MDSFVADELVLLSGDLCLLGLNAEKGKNYTAINEKRTQMLAIVQEIEETQTRIKNIEDEAATLMAGEVFASCVDRERIISMRGSEVASIGIIIITLKQQLKDVQEELLILIEEYQQQIRHQTRKQALVTL